MTLKSKYFLGIIFYTFSAAFILCSFAVHAQDFATFHEVGFSSEPEAGQAKQDIIKEVTERVSFRQIGEMIGDKKVEKFRSLLQNKIIPQSGRFIPFVKPGPLENKDGGFSMTVEMKYSSQSLRDLLRKEGLLASGEGSLSILPMISFEDRVKGQNFQWWVETKEINRSPVVQSSEKLLGKLKQELLAKNFYLLEPVKNSLHRLLPANLHVDRYRAEEMQAAANLFQARFILNGLMTLQKSAQGVQAVLKFAVINVENQRSVAEFQRTQDFYASSDTSDLRGWDHFVDEVSRDISVQLSDSLSRGTLNTSVVRLLVHGASDYKTLENFKKNIREWIEIKNLRERLFEPSGVLLEADSQVGVQELSKRFSSLAGFQAQVSAVSGNQIELSIKAK